MSIFKRLKNSKHFSALSKKKESITGMVEDLNQRHLAIYHIDSETEGNFSLTVKNDDNGDVVLLKVCDHYSLHEYKEYFGLKYTLVDDNGDHEIFWLDPLKTIGKQLRDTNNLLTFRVKHFPGKPHQIQSEYVRYLIFLQIRNYLLKGDLQLALTEETRLAAYAIQAAVGDYDDIENKDTYLADVKFLSHKPKSEEMIREFHKELKGKTPAEMELEFLEKASQFDTYGAELIVVKTSKGVPINFGVSHNGIITYLHGTPANTAKIDMFPWSQIGKISYEGRTLRVHFHTPDQSNSEIIKKQVMIFKCNNNRICKHLWKFVLDQKAFFNFKRGVDVPKMKSSDRLFTFKSKFKYSGRCENEVIAAQTDTSSFMSISMSNADSQSSYSTLKSNGIQSNGTLKTSESFKRRTFLLPQRAQFIRTKHHENNPSITSTKTDSNNNSISPSLAKTTLTNENVAETATLKLNETQSIKSSISVQNDLNLVNTEQLNKINQIETDSIPEQIPIAQATSTPTLGAKLIDTQPRKSSTATLKPENEPDSVVKRPIFTIPASEGSDDDDTNSDEDKFYEHDEYLNRQKSPSSTNLTSNHQTINSSTSFISKLKRQQSRLKNISCTICIIVIVLFIFFLFLFLIQHWKCKLSELNDENDDATSIVRVNLNSCGYQRTLSRVRDNFILFMQDYLPSMSSLTGRDRWIPWPIRSDSSYNESNESNYDPLFFWFFRQYEEN